MQISRKSKEMKDIKDMTEHVLPGLILDLINTSLGRPVT